MASLTTPTDAELQTAIGALYSEEQLQTTGLAKVISGLKTSNPSWDPDAVNSKRVRAILQEMKAATILLEMMASQSEDNAVDPNTSGISENDMMGRLDNKIPAVSVETSHRSCKNHQPHSLPHLKNTVEVYKELVLLLPRSELEITYKERGKTERDGMRIMILSLLLFFDEWDGFLGPNPQDPMAPACNLIEDMEPLQFVTLFPDGAGNYLGPARNRVSFEQYVTTKLWEAKFQRHQQWLQWALTMTEDRETAAQLNVCLVVFHGFKAMHWGEGKVQRLPLDEDFEAVELNGEGTKLVKVTIERIVGNDSIIIENDQVEAGKWVQYPQHPFSALELIEYGFS